VHAHGAYLRVAPGGEHAAAHVLRVHVATLASQFTTANMQNIGAGNADDAFYRYKMPKLVAKVEGRGNGIKTNIVNNVDIAKALERPPEYVLKYFGCELGAQTNYDAKTGVSICNGAHEAGRMSEILEGFIKKYVQCYSCGNPETRIKVKKEMISMKCKACGAVSDIDPRHKLNTFIIKNPPEEKVSKEERRLKKAEDERMGEAEATKKKEEKKAKKVRAALAVSCVLLSCLCCSPTLAAAPSDRRFPCPTHPLSRLPYLMIRGRRRPSDQCTP
jgi:translation initiation factor 2 beta subunit (eIF-2beta)/eIF-5